MKLPRKTLLLAIALTLAMVSASFCESTKSSPAEKSFAGPDGLILSVKMIGPATQTTDLQILCILKHSPAGDPYLEALKDLDAKLGGLISALRNRGEFVGEPGETLVFTPPPHSIAAKQVLLIGVGDDASLTPDRLKLVGAVAARESARLNAGNVSIAPVLRDQGSTRIPVADVDAAVIKGFTLALDTQSRLAALSLADAPGIKRFTIEAGPKYFDGAALAIAAAVQSAKAEIAHRDVTPYVHK